MTVSDGYGMANWLVIDTAMLGEDARDVVVTLVTASDAESHWDGGSVRVAFRNCEAAKARLARDYGVQLEAMTVVTGIADLATDGESDEAKSRRIAAMTWMLWGAQ